MSREVKRVPMDFDAPREVWRGYKNPYYFANKICPFCDGSGLNAATKQLSDDWYGFDRIGRRWCDKIEQPEVDALIEHGRLKDFTHTFVSGRWIPIEPQPIVTAEMVNERQRREGLNRHDGI